MGVIMSLTRELKSGEPMAKEVPAFPLNAIEELEKKPLYETSQTYLAEHCFVAIDQTGGSANFAIMSGFFGPDGKLVVSERMMRENRGELRLHCS